MKSFIYDFAKNIMLDEIIATAVIKINLIVSSIRRRAGLDLLMFSICHSRTMVALVDITVIVVTRAINVLSSIIYNCFLTAVGKRNIVIKVFNMAGL